MEAIRRAIWQNVSRRFRARVPLRRRGITAGTSHHRLRRRQRVFRLPPPRSLRRIIHSKSHHRRLRCRDPGAASAERPRIFLWILRYATCKQLQWPCHYGRHGLSQKGGQGSRRCGFACVSKKYSVRDLCPARIGTGIGARTHGPIQGQDCDSERKIVKEVVSHSQQVQVMPYYGNVGRASKGKLGRRWTKLRRKWKKMLRQLWEMQYKS
mmetsp:Transcript_21423/g.45288  ORF Transcript_21423/g.45288 Transcript_21423/m.45288 type:complete len:210 (+) Transcript_21423:219-848(+)